MGKQEELLNLISKSPDNRIKYAVTDIDGILRGKTIHKEKFLDSIESGLGFCDVIFGWDMSDSSYDNSQVTGWHTGYPDAKSKIDLDTYRTIPWEDQIPFFLGDFSEIQHPACPRSLLKNIILQMGKMGYTAKYAVEFEWFNFQEDAQSLNNKQFNAPAPFTPGMFGYSVLRASQNSHFFNDLFVLLEKFNVPVEGIHTETGPGVYEACIQHTSTLEAADRAVLFKTAVKEIASKHDLVASFMAKWNTDLPGCSGHIHQSLWKDGHNAFYDEKRKYSISEILESFVAGQLKCMPEILPMYAPTINSYKRLVEGAWAPTTITWGIDNRTTALRVINSNERSMRLETRVPGADANPYLSMAAALASGLYGIKHQLKLDQPPVKGNGYDYKKNGTLPATLKEASECMKTSTLAKELFGEDFINHFIGTREWEYRQHEKAVTNWELKRYFEII